MYDSDGLIIKTAEAGCQLQSDEGAMPAGRNGPHQHAMTAARNTGHWAITFLHAYKISSNGKFRRAAVKCLDLLISPLLRPMGGAFWHRCHMGRNSFNGLIGQSWSMEALYYGWKILGDEQYRSIALEVFSQHVYDDRLGLWYQLDLDGSAFLIETTLNQQVWLAAMGAWLADEDHPAIISIIRDFLSRLPEKITIRYQGLFPRAVLLRGGILSKVKRLTSELIFQDANLLAEIEYGYHLFTLCGLAHLFCQIPDHEFWSTRLLKRALNFPFNPSFWSRLSTNRYGFPYNVPGFELPYIFSVFRSFVWREQANNLCRSYLSHQLNTHYNLESHLLELGTEDPETLAARFYEICRVPKAFFPIE